MWIDRKGTSEGKKRGSQAPDIVLGGSIEREYVCPCRGGLPSFDSVALRQIGCVVVLGGANTSSFFFARFRGQSARFGVFFLFCYVLLVLVRKWLFGAKVAKMGGMKCLKVVKRSQKPRIRY